jgi:hypothetical protein
MHYPPIKEHPLKNVQKIYLHVRPRIQHTEKVIDQVEDLMLLHPGAHVDICGFSLDGTHSTITLELNVPKSNVNAVAISGLHFAQAVFATLFDHTPCYSGIPSDIERKAAEEYLTRRNRGQETEQIAPITEQIAPISERHDLVKL